VVRIHTADGKEQIAQLDGGGGHSGKRSFDVFFGLGDNTGPARPASIEIAWRDVDGGTHKQSLQIQPGWHDLMLTDDAKVVTR
jgi:hypothetical protein